VAAQRLQGDAARSVIVENKSQNVYAIFGSYRF
jgi:outer membrane scaffolding protein for murein synthesis (MipA/OmpV family)